MSKRWEGIKQTVSKTLNTGKRYRQSVGNKIYKYSTPIGRSLQNVVLGPTAEGVYKGVSGVGKSFAAIGNVAINKDKRKNFKSSLKYISAPTFEGVADTLSAIPKMAQKGYERGKMLPESGKYLSEKGKSIYHELGLNTNNTPYNDINKPKSIDNYDKLKCIVIHNRIGKNGKPKSKRQIEQYMKCLNDNEDKVKYINVYDELKKDSAPSSGQATTQLSVTQPQSGKPAPPSGAQSVAPSVAQSVSPLQEESEESEEEDFVNAEDTGVSLKEITYNDLINRNKFGSSEENNPVNYKLYNPIKEKLVQKIRNMEDLENSLKGKYKNGNSDIRKDENIFFNYIKKILELLLEDYNVEDNVLSLYKTFYDKIENKEKTYSLEQKDLYIIKYLYNYSKGKYDNNTPKNNLYEFFREMYLAIDYIYNNQSTSGGRKKLNRSKRHRKTKSSRKVSRRTRKQKRTRKWQS